MKHALQKILTASMLSYALLLPSSAQATQPVIDHQAGIRHYFAQPQPNEFGKRLKAASASFLGQPYLLGALGEGSNGRFDQHPLYRDDGFDCLTYVSTVLAMARSHSMATFEQELNRIRYRQGIVGYFNRNHFTSVDWNLNNASRGVLRDISYRMVDGQGKPVAVVSSTTINKPAWYRKAPASRIELQKPLNKADLKKRLDELHQLATKAQQEKAVTVYIPLSQFINGKGQVNQSLLAQIPDGAILEIVRPGWNLVNKIGTRLNISHLGFAFRDNKGQLVFRQASSRRKQIIDVPLTQYLKQLQTSPTIKGISVWLPKK